MQLYTKYIPADEAGSPKGRKETINMRNFNFKLDLGRFREDAMDQTKYTMRGMGMDIDSNYMDEAFASYMSDIGFTSEEVESAKYEAAKIVLFGDVLDCNYERIQKLLEAEDISSEQMADMVDEQRYIKYDFEEMAFADLVCLLSNRIALNPMLGEMFVSLYSEKYCNVPQIVKSITKKGLAKNKRKIDRLSKEEVAFCFYLLMDIGIDSRWTGLGLDFEAYSLLKAATHFGEVYLTSEYEGVEEALLALTFSETEDSIFQSRQFAKFLSKRMKEIAEFLGVEENEVNKTLAGDMVFSNDIEEKYYQSKAAKGISAQVLIENNGTSCWLGDFEGCGYRDEPDIDRMIRSYYMIQVFIMYEHAMDNTGRFTKLDLSRGWDVNPERDVQGICYMYCLDVFCKMFNELMKEYYKAFFEGKFAPRDTAQDLQMEDRLNEQNLVIEKQKEQIASLEKQIVSLEAQSLKNKHMERESEKMLMECERKNQKLGKEIEKSNEEITHLKDFIESQNEFLAMLNQTEEGEVGSVDMDMLQTKRYLFVGKTSEALPDLKKKFPGSVFMETETKDISGIHVNSIVFLTKWMSHGMYYKVRNSKIFREVPLANCNTKNIDRIYYDMDRQLAAA